MGTIQICKWKKADCDNYFESDCKFAFMFNDDGPRENGFSFCPKCGRIIEQVYPDELS